MGETFANVVAGPVDPGSFRVWGEHDFSGAGYRSHQSRYNKYSIIDAGQNGRPIHRHRCRCLPGVRRTTRREYEDADRTKLTANQRNEPTVKKKKYYTVVAHEDLGELLKRVEAMLQLGWKCQGGIAQGANSYLQALTKGKVK